MSIRRSRAAGSGAGPTTARHAVDLDAGTRRPQALQPGRVPVPVGRGAAHRPCPDLHRRRRLGPLPAPAWLHRVPAVRLRCLRHQRRELRPADRGASPPADRPHDGHLPPPDRSLWAGRGPGTPRSSPATLPTTAGPSGCSCGCSRPGWPTRPRRRCCGAPRAGRCWPGSRSTRRTPGPRCERCGARRRRSGSCASGSCASTAYADRLLDGLDDLDWPDKAKNRQRRVDRPPVARRRPGDVPAARLADLAAALLGSADPDHPLWTVRGRSRPRRRAARRCCPTRTIAAACAPTGRAGRRWPRSPTGSTCRVRGAARPAGGRPTCRTRSSTRRGTSCATRPPTSTTGRGTPSERLGGCRSTSTPAGRST